LLYFMAVFGFEIRLQLSAWAGTLLRFIGFDVQTLGNVLVLHASSPTPIEMAVDPACTGLQMTGISLLVGAYLLMQLECRKRKRLSLAWLVLYVGCLVSLTVVCNLIRIMLLVAFAIGPDQWLHDAIGLICVVIYTWLPSWALATGLVNRFGTGAYLVASRPSGGWWGVAVLLIGLGVMYYTSQPTTVDSQSTNNSFRLWQGQGFVGRQLPNGFLKFTKPGVLVYVKPVTDWWSAEHSPTACWRGSGYEIRHARRSYWQGRPCYMAELRKPGQPTLYTVWWFSNGDEQTVSQIGFRWRMVCGAPNFSLVNLTVEHQTQLVAEER